LITGEFNCLNWQRREEGKVGGGVARRGEDHATASGRLGNGEKKKKGKGKGRLTGGAQVSASAEKKKKERRITGRCGIG
jgi:hypothetical protein